MSELTFKVEVPKSLEKEWKQALEEFIEELRTRVLLSVLAKSKLSEAEALKLGEEIKHGIAKRHGL